MVNDISLGWKVLKMPFILLAFPITLRFDTLRGYLKDKRKLSYDFMFPKRKSHYLKVYKQGYVIFTPCLRDDLSFSKTSHSDYNSKP